MVIFSRWQPDGGYDYYEADYVAPIGDDLPDPVAPVPTQLGVPSVECGHRVPVGARYVGEGPLPKGIVAPMDTSRLGQLLPGTESPLVWLLVGAAAAAVATWAIMRRRR